MRLVNKFLNDTFYRQTVAVFCIKVFSSILGFFTTILLVKSLGGEGSSDYFFLVAIVSVFTAITTFGSPDAILKFVAINKKAGKLVMAVVKNTCLYSIILSLIITLIAYIANRFESLSSETFFIFSILTVLPLASISLVLSSALQGSGRVTLAMLTSGVVQNICVLSGLLFIENSYLATALSFAVGNFLASIVAICYLKIDLNNNDEGAFDLVSFKSTCSSMFVSQCVIQYNNHSAILLLGLLWVGKDLSIMAVSLKLTTLLSFIIIAVNRVLAPQIASTYKGGDLIALQKLVTKSSRLMWTLCFPAVFIIIVFSQELLGLIDKSYPEQYLVLIVLAIGQLVNVLTGNIGLLLSMTGHEKAQRNILLVSLIVSLIIGVILIPNYGPLGAAMMASTTTVLVNVASYIYVLTKLRINTFKLF